MTQPVHFNAATVTIEGTEYTATLATVERTMLGYEDHGTVRADLSFTYGGYSQATPGIAVSEPSVPAGESTRRQIGTAVGMDHIIRIIDVFGGGEWENIKGKQVYILKSQSRGVIDGLMSIHDNYRHYIFAQRFEDFASRGTVEPADTPEVIDPTTFTEATPFPDFVRNVYQQRENGDRGITRDGIHVKWCNKSQLWERDEPRTPTMITRERLNTIAAHIYKRVCREDADLLWLADNLRPILARYLDVYLEAKVHSLGTKPIL